MNRPRLRLEDHEQIVAQLRFIEQHGGPVTLKPDDDGLLLEVKFVRSDHTFRRGLHRRWPIHAWVEWVIIGALTEHLEARGITLQPTRFTTRTTVDILQAREGGDPDDTMHIQEVEGRTDLQAHIHAWIYCAAIKL